MLLSPIIAFEFREMYNKSPRCSLRCYDAPVRFCALSIFYFVLLIYDFQKAFSDDNSAYRLQRKKVVNYFSLDLWYILTFRHEKKKNECIQFNHAPTTALILFLSLFCFGLFPFFCQKFTALTIFVSFFISFLPTFPIYQVLSRRLLISRLFNKFVNWSYTDHNGFACNLSHLTDHLLSNSMKKFNTKKIIKKYYNKKYLAFHTILFCYMKEKIKLP